MEANTGRRKRNRGSSSIISLADKGSWDMEGRIIKIRSTKLTRIGNWIETMLDASEMGTNLNIIMIVTVLNH